MPDLRRDASDSRLLRLRSRFVVALRALSSILILLGPGGCAKPAWEPVPAGESHGPRAEEGLLVLDVDSDVPIERLETDGSIAATRLPRGRHTWIVRARPGSYAWRHVVLGQGSGFSDSRVSLPDDDEFRFDVVAGRLNYPGELVIRSDAWGRWRGRRIEVRNRNHAASALRTLRGTHSALLSEIPLRTAGASADRFLERYDEARSRPERPASEGPNPLDGTGSAGPAGLSAETVFSPNGIALVTASPSGRWASALARKGEVSGVLVQDLGTQKIETVHHGRDRVESIDWVGPDRLMVSTVASSGRRHVTIRLRRGDGRIVADRLRLDAPGRLVHPLPLEDEEVVWEFRDEERVSLNRVRVDELAGYRERHSGRHDPTQTGSRLTGVRGYVVAWVVDREGYPRAALRREEDGYTLFARASNRGGMAKVYRFTDDEGERWLWPHAVASDGERLLVRAYAGEDTRAIVEFDVETRTFGKTIYRMDDQDVVGVDLDFIDGRPIAAVYERDGERRRHHFETFTKRRLGEVDESLRSARVVVVSGSADRSMLILYASGSNNPGTFHFHETSSGRLLLIGQRHALVERDRLQPTETIEVTSADGTRVEAFLTLPRSTAASGRGGAPLIVYPHGGPIGVRDTKDFDPMVQYLASWGFATLKVNYRGSSGYGRRFQEAGKREWALGIEDDIDAAVELVMARPEIDASRVCMVGGSYGGFSALASLVRHPDRYRCAVTINGVTDIPLLFETSDFADSPRALESFAEIVGDPESERDRLIELSPLYRTAEIRAPVLVVFGTADRRVDPEHAHRLLLMLEAQGGRFEELEIRDGAHSPTPRERTLVARRLRHFLTRQLHPGATVLPDPPVEGAGFDLLIENDY